MSGCEIWACAHNASSQPYPPNHTMRAVVLIAVVAVAFADFLPRFPDEPIEAHPDSLQQASIIKKLVGVFVAPCVASSWFQPGAL